MSNEIIVVYHVGNKRLLDKLPIKKFEHERFDSCSNYDQHRLTKFDTKAPDQASLWQSTVTLSQGFFNEIVDGPIPIDTRVLKAL